MQVAPPGLQRLDVRGLCGTVNRIPVGLWRYWTWHSRRKGDRPGIDPEIRTLIMRMASVTDVGPSSHPC